MNRRLIVRSIVTAIIVGSILVLINQWHAVFSDTPVNLGSLILTYMVPFCVSTFSGYMSRKESVASSTSDSLTLFSPQDCHDQASVVELLSLTNKITSNAKQVNQASSQRVKFDEHLQVLQQHQATLDTALTQLKDTMQAAENMTNDSKSSMQKSGDKVYTASQAVGVSLRQVSEQLSQEKQQLNSIASNVETLVNDSRKAIEGSSTNMNLGSRCIELVGELRAAHS